MNLHPLIVHFPVALLTLYAGVEVFSQFWYKYDSRIIFAKKWLLWLGTIGVFAALASGEAAQEIYGRSSIIHLHEEIAEMVNIVFIITSLIYLLDIPTTPLTQRFISSTLLTKLPRISQILQRFKVPLLLALVGFVLLASLGAVGGAISRGPQTDPLANFIIEKFGNEATYNAGAAAKNTQKTAE